MSFTGMRADSSGTKRYYRNGEYHRGGGLPAAEYADGSKEYWVNGKPHRDGGLPAVEWANGDKEYFVNGKPYRDGGLPAIEWASGTKAYHVNGKRKTEEEMVEILVKQYNISEELKFFYLIHNYEYFLSMLYKKGIIKSYGELV